MTPPLPDFRPRPFRPAPWARGPHLQTLLARALRSGEGPPYTRERLATPDGDFLELDWSPEPGRDAPVVLVVHGLEGSARRRYVRNVCRELLARKLWPVALNLRGCSGEPNRAARFYHSGETTDPLLVLEMLRSRYPDRKVGVFGFSLGGNILLKLLGERPDGGRGMVDGAVAMSVPYDLSAGAGLLEARLVGRLYGLYFLRSLKRKVRAKEALLDGRLDLERVLAAPTIRAFDDAATAPLHGFRGAEHYYGESSSAGFLEGIGVPTLLVHSLDDPFLPSEAIPRKAMDDNPRILAAITPGGGHVGFLEGTPLSPRFWGDEEGARFLGTVLRDGEGGDAGAG